MKRTFFLLLVAAAFGVAQPAVAQKFLPKTIQFKGAPDYSDKDLMAAAGLEKGTTLDFAEMKQHSQKLMDTGLFETLNFKFDGVDLVYNLVPSSALFSVSLDNLPIEPGKDLESKLHSRLPLYRGKVPSEGGLLDGVRGVLEEMLADEGIKAAVTVMPSGDSKLNKVNAMNFTITAPPVRVGAIHIEGVSGTLGAGIQRAADHETGSAYGTENSGKNVEHAIELFLGDEGYAAAKVHVTRSGNPVASADGIDVPFSATVEEGRLYKLGSIHLPPDAPVTQAEIDKIVGQSNGNAKGQTLRDAWYAIVSRYKSKGFLDCVIVPHPEIDDASGIANYRVEVIAGQVYHLAFVKFDNVSDELRMKLMRVWQMLPGDPFDESYVAGFITKAQKDDPVLMRSLSGVAASYKISADPETHEVSCVLRFARLKPAP